MTTEPIMGLALHPSVVGTIVRALVIAEAAKEAEYKPLVRSGQMQLAEVVAELTDYRMAFDEVWRHCQDAIEHNPRLAQWLPVDFTRPRRCGGGGRGG